MQVNPKTDVVYCAMTGKATQVLKNKGNPNTKTLHKLLWKWGMNEDTGEFEKEPIRIFEKIVVVDEASMVSQEILDELLSRPNIYILFLGDPAQLEPVGGELTDILKHPHIFLDEIMRQALDSGIIRMSMMIREGQSFDGFKSDDVQVLSPSALSTGMLTWADIVLCGTNKTRTMLNQKIRELQGKTGAPQDGDKLICLQNYWRYLSSPFDGSGNKIERAPLVNGCIGTFTNPQLKTIPYNIKSKRYPKYIDCLCYQGKFITELGEVYPDFRVNVNALDHGKYYMDKNDERDIYHGYDRNRIPKDMYYGYAITTWKSQGSEWDKVLLICERFPYEREERKKFLYTACTRASSKLVVINDH